MNIDMQTFSAKVGKIDLNPYVEVPDDILRKLQQDAKKERGPIPVKGMLQGKPFSTTVVKFRGMGRLYLDTPTRQAAKVDVGDQVTIHVQLDQAPPKVRCHESLRSRFRKTKQPKKHFRNWPNRVKQRFFAT
jgi:hypothetical protein